MQTDTPIYDQLARERDTAPDPYQDPEGLGLVAAIHERHAARCATHEHHRRTLAGWFGRVKP